MSVRLSTSTPSSTRPLETLKRLPATAKMSTPTKSAKRARISLVAPMTPQHSSDNEDMFSNQPMKFTAVPLRVSSGGPLTPSTSTVAFSSSPNRRMMMSSSPTKYLSNSNFQSIYNNKSSSSSNGFDHDITLTEEISLIFGRHRHNKSSSSSSSHSSISSSIPSHLHHLLGKPENKSSIIHLSKHASHASRVHAIIELLSSSSSENHDVQTIRIIVIGQNGMKVKIMNKKRGVRLLQGQKYDLELTSKQSAELDFFGSKVLIRLPQSQLQSQFQEEDYNLEREKERLFSSSPILRGAQDDEQNQLRLDSSMPPSSPPILPMDLDDEELSELESEVEQQKLPKSTQPKPQIERSIVEDKEEEEDRQSRQSSPLSPPSEPRLSPLPELENEAEPLAIVEQAAEAEEEKQVKAERIESISNHDVTDAASRPTSRANTPILPVPKDLDLPAIIASTVVFSGSSKLSLPDLVKHMLESQPSLKEHGSEKTWSLWVGESLDNNEMFGKVERHGKDASGHPLLPHYYYNPSADPDSSRAQELGALVRPLRTAQRTGGKVIDWRPVGRGRRHF
ncbi:uncharacterized protein L201_006386 [Kwoniella dendrophila CBS 6074]|uniref:FHA domain-containing protein n=1 Tax=Kwoniella dendrophila CBS 6074 TaxID=1295534 RepID=A0AAX4K3Q6_9TREE